MDSANNTHLTRRRGILISAALAALPLPAATVLAADQNPHPDAALIELNRRFDELWPRTWDLNTRAGDAADMVDDQVRFEVGASDRLTKRTKQQADEWWQVFCRVRNESGAEELVSQCHDAWEDVDRLWKQVEKIPPVTSVGVAIWGRIMAAVYCSDWWLPDEEEEGPDQKARRLFFENLIKAGGLTMPEGLGEKMEEEATA
jgi:hypothetical protein